MDEDVPDKAEHRVRGRVTRIRGPGEFHRRLMDMGLCYGRMVEVNSAASPQDCIQFYVGGRILTLSAEEAARICLEVPLDRWIRGQ